MSIKDAAEKEIKINLAPETPKKTPSLISNTDVFKTLKKKAKKTELSEYMNHPLNIDNTGSTGRIIRGLEGMFTTLDLAIFDVLTGLWEKLREPRRKTED